MTGHDSSGEGRRQDGQRTGCDGWTGQNRTGKEKTREGREQDEQVTEMT